MYRGEVDRRREVEKFFALLLARSSFFTALSRPPGKSGTGLHWYAGLWGTKQEVEEEAQPDTDSRSL